MVFGYVIVLAPLHLKKKKVFPLSKRFLFPTLGIPFNDTVNWRLEIAEKGQQILGENLLGLQAGNEPDFYATFVSILFFLPSFFLIAVHSYFPNMFRNGHRNSTYAPQDYSNDVQSLIQAMEANSNIPNKNMLICPSVATGAWTPEQVWDTGFINTFNNYISAFAVEQ